MSTLRNTVIYTVTFTDNLAILSLTIKDLQNKIYKLAEYCDTKGPEINLKKAKINKPGFLINKLTFYLRKGQ